MESAGGSEGELWHGLKIRPTWMVLQMAETLMVGSIVVGVANAALALILLALYSRTLRSTKAPFTVALVVFAAAFLLHNLLVVYSYVTMMPIVPYAMMPYLFGIAVLEAGGLGAMVWTATR